MTRHADLAHPGATLLTVGIGEPHALGGDAVDVGGAVPHQAVAVAAEVADADVVAPDDENIGFAVRHFKPPHMGSESMLRGEGHCNLELTDSDKCVAALSHSLRLPDISR
jgi:hypothetical protein